MSQQIEPRMRPRPPPPPPPNPPPLARRKTSRNFDLAASSNSIAAAASLPSLPSPSGASAASGARGGQRALMPRSPLVYAGEEAVAAELNGSECAADVTEGTLLQSEMISI